jgi:hypothetical protein
MASVKHRKVADKGILLLGKGKLLPDVFLDIRAFEIKLKCINKRVEELKVAYVCPFMSKHFRNMWTKEVSMAKGRIFINYPSASKRIVTKIKLFSLPFQ